MASSRALVSGVRCLNCHRQVLQSFIASFSAVTAPHQTQSRQALVPRRAFASSRSIRSDSQPSTRNPFDDDSIEADATLNSAPTYDSLKPKGKTSSGAAKRKLSTSSEDVAEDEDSPWYLSPAAQGTIDAPSSSFVNPLLERQRLPPLPPSPPPILSPLLNHLSIEIGLDYLSLLDLRLMDPPPALGANLFMIFGTARSEKHLNVASDRFCRWLRSTYKLRPFADGLLGRNELRLKLKRKNRRMRMLGAAGISSTQGMDYEDGIGTGWVCVNVGSVEGGSLTDGAVSEVDEADIEGFVGFGGDSGNTSRIVVQMMTEERRGEIDLEALWTQALERSLKAQSRQEEVEIDPGQSGRVFGQRRQLDLAENRAAV